MNYSALSKYRSELMGIAMLWVMLFHTGFDFGVPALNLFLTTGFGGVDIFILLSAMGLALSLSKKEQRLVPFMRRRAVRILPAYFPVMLIYTIILIVRKTAPVSALFWNSTLLSYWIQTEGGFNWYISGIFAFYLLTPVCFRLIKQSKHPTALTCIGVAAGVALYRFMISLELWHYLDFAYRIPIFLLGLLMGVYIWRHRTLSRKDVLFWCFWALCGVIYFVASCRLSPQVLLLPLCPLFLFTTVPTCLAICLLFDRLPLGRLRRVLRIVGESSLEIYLLNVTFFSDAALLQQLTSRPGYPVLLLIALVLNLLLGILLHRIFAPATARMLTRLSSCK